MNRINRGSGSGAFVRESPTAIRHGAALQHGTSPGHSKATNHRSVCGFTLLELLVTIGIVGVIVALLLPAVQTARESGRRISCLNDLREIGLALHEHHESYRSLSSNGGWDGVQTIPSVSGSPFTPSTTVFATGVTHRWGVGDPARSPKQQTGSWLFSILPFVEQSAVHTQRDWSVPMGIYICPSRRRPEALEVVPMDAYGSYQGGGWHWAKTDYAANGYIITGLTQSNVEQLYRFADITDGTSYTLLAGEKAFNRQVQTAVNWYYDEPYFLGGSGGTARRGIVVERDGPTSAFKGDWGSSHAGGANFLFADGSTRLIPFTVPWQVFSPLLTPNGGEPTSPGF